jgi:inorganic pyrophosphatase
MAVRPVGVLKMQDEAGGDEKIIAVPVSRLTRRYERIATYTDLPEITLKQIEHFFQHYKDLEPNKWVRVAGWGGPDEAGQLINEAIDRVRLRIPASRRSSSTLAAVMAEGPPTSKK